MYVRILSTALVQASKIAGKLDAVAVLEPVVDPIKMLIHIHRRFIAFGFAHDARRNPGRSGVRRHGL
ncbi:hypothetical protein SAMN03159294_3706 [Kosakonia radicincitans]|nr:hypothetical protein SAMN03159294_3706 [Kosakonia radicincitans]